MRADTFQNLHPRCHYRLIEGASEMMSSVQRVKLLDAAMRSSDPQGYLDRVHSDFDGAGRPGDALTVMVLRVLIRAGEIEMLMHMRAEWRGERTALERRCSRST